LVVPVLAAAGKGSARAELGPKVGVRAALSARMSVMRKAVSG